ncbi:hypothetical protein LEMLEM_LOCUS27200, partial [Lemmus lemmus]
MCHRPCQGTNKQAALELMEHGLVDSKALSSEPWRGRTLKTMCPEDLMLLLSIILLIT